MGPNSTQTAKAEAFFEGLIVTSEALLGTAQCYGKRVKHRMWKNEGTGQYVLSSLSFGRSRRV